ncbi:hypothetical protein GIB67_002866 [Kingdonia uniflora]|uniref:Uncharacterized protein n=1 Tax=Kingdonia uniflora TaxID=39325 RepID=A0A7J7M5N2_9MAGN|nr:hypothetical protein GIB67_002866 [Kingdonia uniflora]
MVQTRQSSGAQPKSSRQPDWVAELRASLIIKTEKQSQLERQLLEDRELREKESDRERQARVLETKKQEAQILSFQTALKELQSSQQPPALRERETVPIISRVSVHEKLGAHEVNSTNIFRIHYEDPPAPIVSIHLEQEAQTDINRDRRPSKQPEEALRPPYQAPLPECMSEETDNSNNSSSSGSSSGSGSSSSSNNSYPLALYLSGTHEPAYQGNHRSNGFKREG